MASPEMSSWGDLPLGVAADVFTRLLPRQGPWRWALHLPFGGEHPLEGDFGSVAAVNLVCSSWRAALGPAVTILRPPRHRSVPGRLLVERFPKLEVLLGHEHVEGGAKVLRRLPGLRELQIQTQRLPCHSGEALYSPARLDRLALDAAWGLPKPPTCPGGILLWVLAPLTGLQVLNIDDLMLDTSSTAALRLFSDLQYLSVSNVQPWTSITCLRALRVLPNLLGLDLTSGVPNDAISHLLPLTRLKHLGVRGSRNIQCTEVARLTSLETLCLEDCGIQERGLDALGSLTNLKALSLALNATITDLSRLETLTNMTCLDLRGLDIPPRSLVALGNSLTSLTSLTITEKSFPLHGLRRYQSLRQLTVINISTSSVFSLNLLKSLRELNMIFSAGLGLTDEALTHLGRVKSLDSLEIIYCGSGLHPEVAQSACELRVGRPQFTNAGVQSLLRSLPHLAQHHGATDLTCLETALCLKRKK